MISYFSSNLIGRAQTHHTKAHPGHHRIRIPIDFTVDIMSPPTAVHVFHRLKPKPRAEFEHNEPELNTGESSSNLQLIIFFFHGLVRDGKYAEDWISLSWLQTILQKHAGSQVYAASYEQYGEKYGGLGQVDLYALGEILLDGILKVREELRETWNNSCIILVGHSVGGLAIKQLILQAESRAQFTTRESDEDPSLSFLNRVAGIFYLSTPHSDSADLTRLLGRSKDHVGGALAALGKVPQRLNHQFMERRKALRIPAAEVFETRPTKVGSFNDIVVPEASARMDVDVAIGVPMDHFSILKLEEENGQTSYKFLDAQIQKWLKDFEFPKRSKKADSSIPEGDGGGVASETN